MCACVNKCLFTCILDKDEDDDDDEDEDEYNSDKNIKVPVL